MREEEGRRKQRKRVRRMDGSRRRERGNKQKAECYCFALCLEYQPRRSMRQTKISHHEIPPFRCQGKIDRYWSIGNRSDSSDVRTAQLVETVARPGGVEK